MMPILKDYLLFIKCQDLFYRFAKSLGENPIFTGNTTDFLTVHKHNLNKQSELTDYIYQVALEACFYKKRIPNTDLEQFFSHRFKIVDSYGLNNGVSDIITINSLFILNHIANKGLFKNQSIIVYSTPLKYKEPIYKKRQEEMANNYVRESKELTGNTNADLRIGHRIYDIKHTSHTSTVSNHLYPWTYEKVQKNIETHLLSLLDNLKKRNDSSSIHKEILNFCKNLFRDTSLTWPQKNQLWNAFMEENFNKIPKNYSLPMVVQMTDYSYIPKSSRTEYEKVRINPESLDNHMKARQAITGVCVNFGLQHFRNAAFVTEGAISMENIPVQQEVD